MAKLFTAVESAQAQEFNFDILQYAVESAAVKFRQAIEALDEVIDDVEVAEDGTDAVEVLEEQTEVLEKTDPEDEAALEAIYNSVKAVARKVGYPESQLAVVATESVVGSASAKALALEGIKEVAVRIWEAIKRVFNSIVGAFKVAYTYIKEALGGHGRAVRTLKKKVSDIKKKDPNAKFTLDLSDAVKEIPIDASRLSIEDVLAIGFDDGLNKNAWTIVGQPPSVFNNDLKLDIKDTYTLKVVGPSEIIVTKLDVDTSALKEVKGDVLSYGMFEIDPINTDGRVETLSVDDFQKVLDSNEFQSGGSLLKGSLEYLSSYEKHSASKLRSMEAKYKDDEAASKTIQLLVALEMKNIKVLINYYKNCVKHYNTGLKALTDAVNSYKPEEEKEKSEEEA